MKRLFKLPKLRHGFAHDDNSFSSSSSHSNEIRSPLLNDDESEEDYASSLSTFGSLPNAVKPSHHHGEEEERKVSWNELFYDVILVGTVARLSK